MNHTAILLKKNEKNKKFFNKLINSISIETTVIKACISAVDIESYCSFGDEIFLFNKYQ